MDTEETLYNINNNITAEDIDGAPNHTIGVSDSSGTLPQRELFAIGGETEEQSASTEDGSKTQEELSAQQPSQFHEEKNWEICNCGTATAYVNGVTKCPVCGKAINLVVEESASTTSTSATDSLSQTLVTGMAIVPQTSEPFDDQSATSCEPVYQHTRRAVGLDGSRIPSEGDSETSVQIPCVPCSPTLYILNQKFPLTTEQQISVHFAENLEQTRIPSSIKQMEQTQGIKLVSFGDEDSSQQQNEFFHPLCLNDGITVKFELVKQVHRKFRIRNEQPTHEIPLHRIKSLSQHRIPGATLQVRIESLCEPGEVCQDHLRMTMRNGETIHKFLIPIWDKLKDTYNDIFWILVLEAYSLERAGL